MKHVVLSIAALATALGCAPAGSEPALATQSSALEAENGDNLNGDNLNGDNLNGDNLNGLGLGTTVLYVKTTGATVNGGTRLDRVELNGTVFRGWNSSATFEGDDFVGAEFQGVSDNGSTIRLRVTSIAVEAPPDDDVWTYFVEYRDTVNKTWWPLCKDDANAALPAIPVMGRWNHEQGVEGGGAKIADPAAFTFSCKGRGAIAKCVFPIGYKPWKTVSGVNLDRHHQSCVRLIRADFCGDGTPYTRDGERVNLYDALGIQTDTHDWVFEAEWDEHGARCFNPLNRSHSVVPCYEQLSSLTCGSTASFATGTLLMNETPSDGVLD